MSGDRQCDQDEFPSVADPEKYNASHLYGFVEQKTDTDLPDYFKPWTDLAHQTESLVQDGMLRNEVHKLPLLEHSRLSSASELKTALVYLTCISYGYVWCEREDGIPEVLPSCLAVPYAAIAEKLQVLPSISQYSFILLNWRLKNPNGKVELDNMESIVTLRGGSDESWFYCTTVQVELDFAPALSSIIEAQKAVLDGSSQRLVKHLKTIEAALYKMRRSLNRMSEGCRPDVFFNVFRPYIAGWDSQPFKKKNLKGLIYEGVSEQPFCYTGLSAAQSSTLPCLDAAFGVVHDEKEDQSRRFFQEYMPKPHRDLIRAIAAGPSIKQYIHSSGSPEAIEVFNDCLQAMKCFRDSHLQVVTRFIINMAHKKTDPASSSEGATGTGGTDLMTFLKGLRDSTIRAMLRTTGGGEGDADEHPVSMATLPRWVKGDAMRVVQVTSVFVAAVAGTMLIMRKLSR
ncbi:indoleamine 2,3-dioxygenase 2-like [Lytechinus variegatus]|uniref:indoleamine 2,3-dioxygenase 2-like n=1 Tax=Lytechinus variegatus TaxID=7654 RepID=UPI001BB29861|nr:indoleamine 2,3-dioxygenase 2-like [Lytechinus variegatus]